jgi:hypothetical protein
MYFRKKGDSKAAFWRCGVCGADWPHMTPGALAQVGPDVLAIVCLGSCTMKARELVAAALPGSFPELDETGQLVP